MFGICIEWKHGYCVDIVHLLAASENIVGEQNCKHRGTQTVEKDGMVYCTFKEKWNVGWRKRWYLKKKNLKETDIFN